MKTDRHTYSNSKYPMQRLMCLRLQRLPPYKYNHNQIVIRSHTAQRNILALLLSTFVCSVRNAFLCANS